MTAVTIQQELAVLVLSVPADMARVSFPTRRELLAAALVSNATDPVSYIVANKSSVVTSATTRSITNVR